MNTTHQDSSIVAQCSPSGSGAIAVIRISGESALEIASAFSKLSSGRRLAEIETHTISHGYVIDPKAEDEIVDEVLFLVMKAPRTFTGENVVEINSHNNPFIIEKIISLAIEHGARIALPGEFSRRALLNQKLDLIQAEALLDVIHAQSESALKKSMQQLQGSLSQGLSSLETELFRLLSHVEACFEFLDEEQRDLDLNVSFKTLLASLRSNVARIKNSFNQNKHIREGVRVALIGSVNAGKSTLFNALVGKERAIVSGRAGTTRDTIESGIYSDGAFITFVDTAGLRLTSDSIEQEGIERSRQEAAHADIILLIFDASTPPNDLTVAIYHEIASLFPDKVVFVANKIDQADMQSAQEAEFALCTTAKTVVYKVSGKNKQGLDGLNKAISLKVKELFDACKSPYLLTKRQHAIIVELDKKLEEIENISLHALAHELIAYHLREALEFLCQLTGKNVQEKMLDTVFRDFCIGK